MTKEEIFATIKPILCTHLDITGIPGDKSKFGDNVTLEAKLGDDLGADSLDRIELVISYEEKFDIDLSDDEEAVAHCVTVGDQVDKLHAILTAKEATAKVE